jgi:hypothetical protein
MRPAAALASVSLGTRVLLARQAGLAQFTTPVVQRPDVQEMIGKVRCYIAPEAEAAGSAR